MRKLDAPGRVTISFPKKGKTEQAHKGEADINQIMAKAMAGQTSDYIKEYGGRYGDTTSLDYFEASIVIAETNEMFDALPSKIRNRFRNKQGDFLDFVQNPENQEELVKMGLANPIPEPEPPIAPEVQKFKPPTTPAAEPETKK